MTGLDVAMISGSFPPRVCGVADYVSHLAGALRSRGAGVEVWTGTSEAEARPGVVAPVVPGWDASGVRSLARDLLAARPKLVHLQWERGIYDQRSAVPLLLPALLRRAGLPLVTTFHALDGPTGWGHAHRAALMPLLSASRDIVVCSERQLRAVRKLPSIGNRAVLIPIGNVIPVVHQRPRARRAGPLRLAYFGFVWRGRNIETVLRALMAVLAADGEATLDIVGGVKDETYQAELDQLSKTVGGRANFLGAVDAAEVSRVLADADIVLLPFETGVSTGRTTLMAALAHEAPIVTYGAPDNLSPLFEQGVNMCIAPVGDEAAFIAQTVALAADAALRAKLSAGAARLAEALSWPAIADQTLALPSYHKAGIANCGA